MGLPFFSARPGELPSPWELFHLQRLGLITCDEDDEIEETVREAFLQAEDGDVFLRDLWALIGKAEQMLRAMSLPGLIRYNYLLVHHRLIQGQGERLGVVGRVSAEIPQIFTVENIKYERLDVSADASFNKAFGGPYLSDRYTGLFRLSDEDDPSPNTVLREFETNSGSLVAEHQLDKNSLLLVRRDHLNLPGDEHQTDLMEFAWALGIVNFEDVMLPPQPLKHPVSYLFQIETHPFLVEDETGNSWLVWPASAAQVLRLPRPSVNVADIIGRLQG